MRALFGALLVAVLVQTVEFASADAEVMSVAPLDTLGAAHSPCVLGYPLERVRLFVGGWNKPTEGADVAGAVCEGMAAWQCR